MECVFCDLIQKKIPGEIVFENEDIFAFKDIQPLAPVHILLVPKKHIASINELTEAEKNLMGGMILVAKRLARELRISENGYKLLFRVGKWGGQEVSHIHLHLIGGAELYEEIRPLKNN